MTLLLLLLLVVALVAIAGTMGGPTWYRSRPSRRIVNEVVYDDAPRAREEIVEEEIIEDRPVTRGRRRMIEY